jgi:hypothetical protein
LGQAFHGLTGTLCRYFAFSGRLSRLLGRSYSNAINTLLSADCLHRPVGRDPADARLLQAAGANDVIEGAAIAVDPHRSRLDPTNGAHGLAEIRRMDTCRQAISRMSRQRLCLLFSDRENWAANLFADDFTPGKRPPSSPSDMSGPR